MNFEQMLLEDVNKSLLSNVTTKDVNKSPQKFVLTKDMEEQIINEALESLQEWIIPAAIGVARIVGTVGGRVVQGAKWAANTRVAKGLFGLDPANLNKPNLFNRMLSKAANGSQNPDGSQNSNGRFSYNSNMMQQLNQQNSMN